MEGKSTTQNDDIRRFSNCLSIDDAMTLIRLFLRLKTIYHQVTANLL